MTRALRTPETAQMMRMKIAREFPSIVLFPRLPRMNDLSRSAIPVGWLPAGLYVLTALVFLVLRFFVSKQQPAIEAAGLATLVLSFIFLEPRVENALLAVAINQAAPCWFWLSREVGPRFLAAL